MKPYWPLFAGIALIFLASCGAVRITTPISKDPSLAGLLQAVANNDVATAKRFLDAGIDPNGMESAGPIVDRTPLVVAAGDHHVDMARLLIDHGATVTLQDRNGNLPLQRALAWPPNLEHTSPEGSARWKARLELVQLLLDKGADVNAADWSLESPLRNAAYSGPVELAEDLIKRGANINVTGVPTEDLASAPIFGAIWGGQPEIAQVLLDKGADVEAVDGSIRELTPVRVAVERGELDIVKMLIAKGAKVDALDVRDGSTALQEAAANNRRDLCQVLLDAGADVNRVDTDGFHVLVVATDADVIDLLLAHGAKIPGLPDDAPTIERIEFLDDAGSIRATPMPNLSDWNRDEADVLKFRLKGRGLAGHPLHWKFEVLGAGGYFKMGEILDEQDLTNPAGEDKFQEATLKPKTNYSGKKWPGGAYRVQIFIGDVLVKARGFLVGDR